MRLRHVPGEVSAEVSGIQLCGVPQAAGGGAHGIHSATRRPEEQGDACLFVADQKDAVAAHQNGRVVAHRQRRVGSVPAEGVEEAVRARRPVAGRADPADDGRGAGLRGDSRHESLARHGAGGPEPRCAVGPLKAERIHVTVPRSRSRAPV